jgi:hypothetical protein
MRIVLTLAQQQALLEKAKSAKTLEELRKALVTLIEALPVECNI